MKREDAVWLSLFFFRVCYCVVCTIVVDIFWTLFWGGGRRGGKVSLLCLSFEAPPPAPALL